MDPDLDLLVLLINRDRYRIQYIYSFHLLGYQKYENVQLLQMQIEYLAKMPVSLQSENFLQICIHLRYFMCFCTEFKIMLFCEYRKVSANILHFMLFFLNSFLD